MVPAGQGLQKMVPAGQSMILVAVFVQVLTAETRFLKTREPVRTFFYLAHGDGALGLRGSPPTPVGCACRLRGVSCRRGTRL